MSVMLALHEQRILGLEGGLARLSDTVRLSSEEQRLLQSSLQELSVRLKAVLNIGMFLVALLVPPVLTAVIWLIKVGATEFIREVNK